MNENVIYTAIDGSVENKLVRCMHDPESEEAKAFFYRPAKETAQNSVDENLSLLYAGGNGSRILANGIATIGVNGCLGAWRSYEGLSYEISALAESDDVKAIVLAIDSPGGYVSGLFECAKTIEDCKKPVYAYVSGGAYSAAYLLATATKKIYISEHASGAGCCGCQAVAIDDSGLMEKLGLKQIVFTSKVSPKKNMPLTEKEAAEREQKIVDSLGEKYMHYVSGRRGVAYETALDTFGKGACLTVDEAMAADMIDEKCADFDDAVQEILKETDGAASPVSNIENASLSNEGGKDESMDWAKVSDEEMKAELSKRENLVASLTKEATDASFEKGKAAGVTAERQRIADLNNMGKAFAGKADAIIASAVQDGKSVEDAMKECVKACGDGGWCAAVPGANQTAPESMISGTPEVNPKSEPEENYGAASALAAAFKNMKD